MSQLYQNDIVNASRHNANIKILLGGLKRMNNLLGPRDRNNLTENEEIEVLEAYQSAEEYLDMRVDDDDFFFDTEEY